MAWTPESNPFGSNRTPALFALSNAADGTFVPLAADPATGRLLVNSTSGAGGGTSSTFGATFPTTGTAAGAKDDTSGLMVPLTSHNVIGVTESLNVFVQNNTAGSILGRVNLYDTSDTNGQNVSSAGAAYVNVAQVNGQTTNLTDTGTQAVGIFSAGNTANVIAGDSGFNGVAVAAGSKSQAYSQSTTTPTTALATAGYAYVSVDIQTILGGGGTQFQVSNDNVNWRLIQLANSDYSDLSSTPGNTSAVYSGSLKGAKFFRLNFSGSGGTAAGTIVLSTMPQAEQALFAFQKGNWPLTLNGTNAPMDDTTNFGDGLTTGIAAVGNRLYNGTGYDRLRSASTTANTTGVGLPGAGVLIWDGTNFQLQKDTTARGDSDNTGYLGAGIRLFNGSNYDRWRGGGVTGMAGVSLQASPSGGWSFINISTASTTTIKSGAGTFHLACVNSLGTVSSTATFYNNTAGSGTVIAIINTLALSGSFTYDIAFTTGLTLVLTGTVSPNVTVAWI